MKTYVAMILYFLALFALLSALSIVCFAVPPNDSLPMFSDRYTIGGGWTLYDTDGNVIADFTESQVTTLTSLTLTTDLSVANGGSGASTLTGVLAGNGTSAFTAYDPADNVILKGSGTGVTASSITDTGSAISTASSLTIGGNYAMTYASGALTQTFTYGANLGGPAAPGTPNGSIIWQSNDSGGTARQGAKIVSLTEATGGGSIRGGLQLITVNGNIDTGYLVLTGTGKVGIQKTTPSYELDVAGNVYAASDVSALTFTDRTKTPKDKTEAREMVKSIRPVKHLDGSYGVDYTQLDSRLVVDSTKIIEHPMLLDIKTGEMTPINLMSQKRQEDINTVLPAGCRIEVVTTAIAEKGRNATLLISAMALMLDEQDGQLVAMNARIAALERVKDSTDIKPNR